ncbi:hypothetical protein ABZS88_06660 [Streptomyces sp. NPDC005480]|uniref:hypothetical protein n=1 Tax=Streptomyces sp. NPDC005480 TaxID=3154880 RepID=UPI00339E9A9A
MSDADITPEAVPADGTTPPEAVTPATRTLGDRRRRFLARGARHVRSAYLVAGDTVGLVVQSRKGTAPAVPFRQAVVLQSQLLG